MGSPFSRLMKDDIDVPAYIHLPCFGVLIIGWIICLFQLCCSSARQMTAIIGRLLIFAFATAAVLQDALISVDYLHPQSHSVPLVLYGTSLVTIILAVTLCCRFVDQSATSLYRHQMNQNKPPLWFDYQWFGLQYIHYVFVVTAHICAFSLNGLPLYPIWIYKIFQRCHIIYGTILAALLVSKVYSNISRALASHSQVLRSINKTDLAESLVSLSSIASNTSNKFMEDNRALHKAKKQLLMHMAFYSVLILICTSSLIYLVSPQAKALRQGTLHDPPNSDTFSYLIHMTFDYVCVFGFPLWQWTPFVSFSKLPKYSVCYLCYPCCSSHNYDEFSVENVNPLIVTVSPTLTAIKPTFLTVPNSITSAPTQYKISHKDSQSIQSKQSLESITVVIIPLERVMLLSKKAFLFCDDALSVCQFSDSRFKSQFGGDTNLQNFRELFGSISTQALLYIISLNLSTTVIESILMRAKLYSQPNSLSARRNPISNETIDEKSSVDYTPQNRDFGTVALGCDNEWIQNSDGSITKLILTIIQRSQCNYAQTLYIDSDLSIVDHLQTINLCRSMCAETKNIDSIVKLKELFAL